MPWEIEDIAIKDRSENPAEYGIHAHNDCGLAVANTLIAIKAGAIMAQGTMNGYGERTGNADLTSIIPDIQVKMGFRCISEKSLKKLTEASRLVSDIANMTPVNSRPWVGSSAFAHKGGIHVSAIMKDSRAYEHCDPSLVGNERRVLVSSQAGKSNLLYKAEEMAISLNDSEADSGNIVKTVKKKEEEGYRYEAAEASLELLMKKETGKYKPLFFLEFFNVMIMKERDNPCKAFATVKISHNGSSEIQSAEGRGPVSALDNALRKALKVFFKKDLEEVRLTDYKVRVISGQDGTGAVVRVNIDSRDHIRLWSTVGVSSDIIEASWHALEESMQFKLIKNGG